MPDDIKIKINDKEYGNISSLSVDSDLFVADDEFSIELTNSDGAIECGSSVDIFINQVQILSGFILKIKATTAKTKKSVVVAGLDVMGLLTRACCEEFMTYEGGKVKGLAEYLIRSLPFAARKQVKYLPGCESLDFFGAIQIEPGVTIYDCVARHAAMRSLLFYSEPNGDLVLGKPVVGGPVQYTLTNKKNNRGNNILESELDIDIGSSYSSITIISQQQGGDNFTAPANIDQRNTITNRDFPSYLKIPYVQVCNGEPDSPDKIAKSVLNKVRREQFVYTAKTKGFTQNGFVWQPNTLVYVDDDSFAPSLSSNMLIYNRKFDYTKDTGTTTTLKCGKVGWR